MKFHVGKRLFLVAAVLGGVAVFAAVFFVALAVRSVVADPGGPVPNPGHQWAELQDHGLSGSDYWLGTTDSQALELRVNGERALRLEPGALSPNLIGGYSGNHVTDGAEAATISGGGIALPGSNRVSDDGGTVGGGVNNRAGDDDGDPSSARSATVSGGSYNTASWSWATVGGGLSSEATAESATVAGGYSNKASAHFASVGGGYDSEASGFAATVGGGDTNTASGDTATVGGGESNTASANDATVGGGLQNIANGSSATISGGYDNAVSGDYATVAGGYTNVASGSRATVGGGSGNIASGSRATVGGGWGNIASGGFATVSGGYNNTASGHQATVPGGSMNTAQGTYSLAAGRRAKAYNNGCFVWADSTDAKVECNNNDRFIARASGGVYLYTNSGLTSGSYLAAGSSSWSSVSDRDLKENFTPVDGQEVLASLAEIPITAWNYEAQDSSIRHMGPVAQDFYAAFGLGESDTAISTVDLDGVALAAIQGLYELAQEQDARIQALEARVAALEGGAEASGGSAGPLSSVMPFGPLLLAGLIVGGVVLVQRRRAGGRS